MRSYLKPIIKRRLKRYFSKLCLYSSAILAFYTFEGTIYAEHYTVTSFIWMTTLFTTHLIVKR